MRFFDFISLTLESTRGNILRTFLSIISIVIGVFSFVFVISLNEGMARNVMKTVEDFGGYNTFDIRTAKKNIIRTPIPNSRKRYKINYRYPITLALIDSLNSIFPEGTFATEVISKSTVVIDGNEFRLYGVSDKHFEIFNNLKIVNGRKFNYLDIKNKNNSIIVVKDNSKDKLSTKSLVDNFITINNYQFKIIGERAYDRFGAYSRTFFIPITTMVTLFPSEDIAYRKVFCKVKDISKMNYLIKRVQNYLDLITSKDMFFVESREESIKDFEDISTSYSNLILLFSVLMLITGGIGIMNIMLASIKERMREIGIKKAVGAKNRDIFIQFLLETLFLFFIGGSFGLILAIFSVESAAEFIIKKQFWGVQAKALITLNVVFTSIIFTGITGLVFGLLPAIKASKVMPIDSLRYE